MTDTNAGLVDLNKVLSDALVAAHDNLGKALGAPTLVSYYPRTLAATRAFPPEGQVSYVVPLVRHILADFEINGDGEIGDNDYLDTAIAGCVVDMFEFIVAQQHQQMQAEAHAKALKAQGQSKPPGIMMPQTGLIT